MMRPRRPDPQVRLGLIEIAARLLIERGPQGLSVRRIATEAGTSTMVVYTHFGGKDDLVRAMVHEGFLRLQEHLTGVPETADPVVDLMRLGRAYRHNARGNPHLYAVMFGGSSLAGFTLTDADRQHGRYTLTNVTSCVRRCIAAGRFRPGDAELLAHQMWIALHGLIILELGGYLVAPYDADACFDAQLIGLMVGAGDSRPAARRSASSCPARPGNRAGPVAHRT